MSLRNKIAFLSATLMSLMTIPTLATNDNTPVTSRIESESFDVQIKTPEGWSETKDFTSIPKNFTFDGQVFRGLQFKNGSELHGCAIFFSEDTLDDDEDDSYETLFKNLTEIQELTFPGSAPFKFTFSKITVEESHSVDITAKTMKAGLKGTVEGILARETKAPAKLTITGSIHAGSAVVGTGTVIEEGTTPISGAIGMLEKDDYQVIIALWGTDEESLTSDTFRFLEAVAVKAKAPAETDAVAISEAVDVTSDAVVVTESVTAIEVEESAPVTPEAST